MLRKSDGLSLLSNYNECQNAIQMRPVADASHTFDHDVNTLFIMPEEVSD
jgi:hypothetical protein